jgi:tripartite-type tricarboxylate transporter receptor subunit TctC
VTMWNGLFAPAGTPPEIVEKLAAAATRAVASPDLQSKIKNNGGDPIVMVPREFGDYLQKDINRWSEAIEAAGIKPQ